MSSNQFVARLVIVALGSLGALHLAQAGGMPELADIDFDFMGARHAFSKAAHPTPAQLMVGKTWDCTRFNYTARGGRTQLTFEATGRKELTNIESAYPEIYRYVGSDNKLLYARVQGAAVRVVRVAADSSLVEMGYSKGDLVIEELIPTPRLPYSEANILMGSLATKPENQSYSAVAYSLCTPVSSASR